MVLSLILDMSSGIIRSWWYPNLKSILEKISWSLQLINKSFTWAMGICF